jgi:membrane protein
MTDSMLSTEEQIASIWALGGLSWKELGRRTWGGIDQNDLTNRAYELAYNFLLAVFPMLLFLVALFGVFAKEGSALQQNLFMYAQQALPPAAFTLVSKTLEEVTKNTGGGKLTFGLVLALYSASGGMLQLMTNLNNAYAVREGRSWIKRHLIAIALTAGISVLVIAALFLVLGGGQVADWAGAKLGLGVIATVGWKVLEYVFALAFIVFSFAIIYYFAPDLKERHWYWITPGSVIGVLLWIGITALFRVYLHFFNSYSKTYGSLGAVIILLFWFYVTGLAFLVGGEINATIEHAAAEHGHPEAKPEGKKAA